MKNSEIIFEEKSEVGFKFIQSPEYISYATKLTVKSSGKKPVTLVMKFNGIYPFAAPMPPEKYKISAENVMSLSSKLFKWAKKYGYILQY